MGLKCIFYHLSLTVSFYPTYFFIIQSSVCCFSHDASAPSSGYSCHYTLLLITAVSYVRAWPRPPALPVCVFVCVRLTCLGCSIARCRSVFTLFPGWLVTLVTGCLKMEAVCLMGRAVFRSGFPPCTRQTRIWMLVFGFFCSLTSYVLPSHLLVLPPFYPSFTLAFSCSFLPYRSHLPSYTWDRHIKPVVVSVSVWYKLKGLTLSWDNNRKCVFVCLCAHK